jgi:hypothetical protein
MKDIHIIPIGDLHRHLERPDGVCWCAPGVTFEGETRLIVHHAEDGRELVEQHGIN